MRTALVLTGVLGLAACTAQQPPVAGPPPPTGPCAQTREQPPDGSQEQRLQGDLDGDGRSDEVVSWVRDGQRVVQAWLATGENAQPQQLFSGELVEVRGAQVVAEQAPGGPEVVLELDGCELVPAATPSPAPS